MAAPWRANGSCTGFDTSGCSRLPGVRRRRSSARTRRGLQQLPANDCPSFDWQRRRTPTTATGCEAGDGETCYNTSDCNGKLNGKPANRFCCGFDAERVESRTHRTADGDASAPAAASPAPRLPVGGGGSTCCGDLNCEDPETSNNCAIDCGAPSPAVATICDPATEDQCSCRRTAARLRAPRCRTLDLSGRNRQRL